MQFVTILRIVKKFCGDLIKAARTNLGMTRRELAERCGVSEKTIWNWEKGKTTPSVNDLPWIAESLQRSEEWFFGQS